MSDLAHTKILLFDGHASIPAMGFGTLIPDPVVTKNATTTALQAGFRHLDCAERYRNERQVGEAIRAALDSGVLQRRDLFVTTKLWNNNIVRNVSAQRCGRAWNGAGSIPQTSISCTRRLPSSPATSRSHGMPKASSSMTTE